MKASKLVKVTLFTAPIVVPWDEIPVLEAQGILQYAYGDDEEYIPGVIPASVLAAEEAKNGSATEGVKRPEEQDSHQSKEQGSVHSTGEVGGNGGASLCV